MIQLHRRVRGRKGRSYGHPLVDIVGAVCAVAVVGLACRAPEPPPEAPSFDINTLATDPDIAQLLSRRYEVAQAQPLVADAWTGLGFAFEANDFHPQAAVSYGHAAALYKRQGEDAASAPGDAKNAYRLGVVHLAQGDLTSAAEAFGYAAAKQPSLTAAHWQQGNALLDLGDLDAAEAAYEAAIQQQSNALPARLGMARLALDRGRLPEAEKRLRSILEDVPELSYGRFLLADVQRQMGGEAQDLSGAVATSTVATSTVTTAPEWPDPWQRELEDLRVGFAADMRRAEEALQQGQADFALPLLARLHREHPDDLTATTNLSAAYIGSRRAGEAIALLDGVYAEHPERFTVSMNLAAAHFAVGDLQQALTWSQRAHELDPFKPRALEIQGEIYARLEDSEAAQTAFERALELSPDSLDTLLRLAALHEQAGRWSTAHDVYLRASQLAPQRGDLAFRLGGTLYRMGRPRFALQALEQARQLGIPAPYQGPFDNLLRSTEEAVQRLDAAQQR